MADKIQKTFDHVRGEQIATLRECQLPSVVVPDGSQVSGRSLKATLYAIDSRAGKSGTCWASIDTLAHDSGIRRRTMIRALQGLRALGLLIESDDERDARIKHRRICWTNLADFRSSNQCQTDTNLTKSTGASLTRTSASNARTGASLTRTSASSNTQRVHKEQKGNKESTRDIQISEEEGRRRWRLRPAIDVADLVDPEQVEELFQELLTHERTSGKFLDCDDDRLRFYAFCHAVHRKRHQFRFPLIFLHQQLERGRGAISSDHVDDAHDVAWARRVLRERYTPVLAATEAPRSPVFDAEAQEVQTFERRRSDALRAMWEACKRGEFR